MDISKEKIESIMENLEQPTVEVRQHMQEYRLTLLNIRKSALAGVILLILPMLFLSGVILKHYLQIDFGIFTSVYEWINRIDQQYGDASMLNWIIRALLTLGPLIAIGINLLSVLHFRIEKTQEEIVISLKLKWINWLVILVSATIFTVFFLYLLIDNT